MKWTELIKPEAHSLMRRLYDRAMDELEQGKQVLPPLVDIFRALELTPPEKVKAVIIGQDPYHTPNQANGLAFSVSPGSPLQPSLRNIFKEYHDDLGYPAPRSGDLTRWAEEGVLLLNTSLTVEAHKPNSHASWGWQGFTADILRVCSELPQPIAFLAWGKDAQKLIYKLFPIGTSWRRLMEERKKVCLFSTHPSPFSASRSGLDTPAFLGSKPFSSTNELLEKMGGSVIDWRLA